MVDEAKRNKLITKRLDIQGRLTELNGFIIALGFFQGMDYIKIVKEDNSEKNIQEWKDEIDVEVASKLSKMEDITKQINDFKN
jgi:hypothetical protein